MTHNQHPAHQSAIGLNYKEYFTSTCKSASQIETPVQKFFFHQKAD